MNNPYVLIEDDDDKVLALFAEVDDFDKVRMDGEWEDIPEDKIEEWDGLTVVTIGEEFVDIYDKMLADGEEVTLETIQPYKTEQED